MRSLDKIKLEAKNDAWSHAYLFVGNDVDKINEAIDFITLSKKCKIGDVVALAPEEKTGKAGEIKMEQIKSLLHDVSLTTNNSSRIAVIYSADKLNISSANMLLKTLEEPPKNTIFILVSATESVITTIKSRCRIYNFGISAEKDHKYSYDQFVRDTIVDGFKEIEEIVKNEETTPFLDGLSDYLLQMMSEKHDFKLAVLIEKTQLAKKMIKGNANQRLTLENLFLDIKDHI
jgi:DNA polymerase III delta prime subunit